MLFLGRLSKFICSLVGVKLAKGPLAVGAAEFVAVGTMAFGSSALKALRAVTLQALQGQGMNMRLPTPAYCY